MFDIGWTEMALVAVVAILVIGPKELPVVLRALGRTMGKARAVAREFRLSLDELAREADLSDSIPGPEDFRIHENIQAHNEKILAKEARQESGQGEKPGKKPSSKKDDQP